MLPTRLDDRIGLGPSENRLAHGPYADQGKTIHTALICAPDLVAG